MHEIHIIRLVILFGIQHRKNFWFLNQTPTQKFKITIWKFKFRSIFEMSHIYDLHAWLSKIFVKLKKMWYNNDQLKISLSITHIMSHIVHQLEYWFFRVPNTDKSRGWKFSEKFVQKVTCLKVTHFWEFGCTQNVSLLRMTVYYNTIINNSHTGFRLEVVLGWIIHVVKFFQKNRPIKCLWQSLEKCLFNVLPIIEGQDFAVLAFSFFD